MKMSVLQFIFLFLSAILLLLFLLPLALRGILNIGNTVGAILSALMLLFSLRPDFLLKIHGFFLASLFGRIIYIILSVLALIIISLIVIITVFMVRANNNPVSGNETAVVLGCGIFEDRPSRMMIARLDAALEYLEKNEEAYCIVSGGQGKDEILPESTVMKRYLINHGIDEKRIIEENKSSSTRENLKFSYEIIKVRSLPRKIAIITNEFHEYRSGKIAKSLSLEYAAIPAKTPLWLLPTFYLRELFGIMYEWVF